MAENQDNAIKNAIKLGAAPPEEVAVGSMAEDGGGTTKEVVPPPDRANGNGSPTAAFDSGTLDAAVDAFAARHGLHPYLDPLGRLIRGCFDVIGRARLSVARDPEFPEEWLEIDLTARGDPELVSAAFRRYTEAWLAVAPEDLRDRVRLIIGVG